MIMIVRWYWNHAMCMCSITGGQPLMTISSDRGWAGPLDPACLSGVYATVYNAPDVLHSHNHRSCRGILHTKLNDLEAALADFSSVLKLEPANVSALYNRGCIHDQLEQYEAALDDYSKALELDTGSLRASTQS